MPMSWWDFGEDAGYDGAELALYRIECAFCGAKGNFQCTHREAKKNPASDKTLNFDTFKCGNCGNFIMVFWSAAERVLSRPMHYFTTVPWARETTKFPEHWPKDVGRYWMQAQRSLESQNWDAASVMARSAIQLVMRYQKAKGANLKQEIEDLARQGVLPPIMEEWSHEVRELANDSAHPNPGTKGTNSNDARDVVRFLRVLLEVTYDLSHQIDQYRQRERSSGG
jgi:hypothetical protein